MRSGSMIGSGSGVVDGSRFVCRSRLVVDGSRNIGSGFVDNGSWVIRSGSGFVDGSWVIRSGLIRFVMGLTLVFHISNISMLMISCMGDNLGSAIGKGNTIFSSDYTIIILSFLFGEISTGVFIFDTIFISEWPGGQFVLRSMVNRFWVIGSGSRGVVRGRGVIRGGGVGGVIGHGHCHSTSQQHF